MDGAPLTVPRVRRSGHRSSLAPALAAEEGGLQAQEAATRVKSPADERLWVLGWGLRWVCGSLNPQNAENHCSNTRLSHSFAAHDKLFTAAQEADDGGGGGDGCGGGDRCIDSLIALQS